MNILIGKLGRSISFNSEKWSAIGGDNEAPTLILKMAEMYPNDKFYISQSTDFYKTKYAQKFTNIIPLMTGYNANYDNHTYLTEKVKKMGIVFDYCVMYNGITSTNNIPGIWYKNKSGKMAYTKTLMYSQRYCANIVWLLNSLPDLKWMLLTPDPRYFPLMAKDISNVPEYILSQYNFTSNWIYRDYETRNDTFTLVESIYAAIENAFLLNRKQPPKDIYVNSTLKRTDVFNLVLNQGASSSGGLDRYPIVKEWVLNNFDDVSKISIYGKWNEDVTTGNDMFKGPVRIEQLSKLLFNTRYTLVIPIDKNWATAKFVEMSYYGIIPFMHPFYDTQKNINCPEFLRVKTPAELKQKIDFLERNEEARKKILSEIWELYKPYYGGKELIEKQIYNRITKTIENEK